MTSTELETALAPVLQLGTSKIVMALLLALGLGLAVAMVYRVSVPGRVLSPAMQASLVLLAMVAAMVMMVIGNNIARAFSLVGALAIVRFRTRLRSSWDISFVFFALAAGIGCGVLAWRVATIGTGIISLSVLALNVLPLAGLRANRIRNLRCDVAAFEGIEDDMLSALDRFVSRRWLVEARSLRFGEGLSFRYRVQLRDPGAVARLLREVGGVEGVERVVVDSAEETGSEG